MGYSQNSLTSAIYEMALGRSNWDSILDILSAAFPDCLVMVHGHDISKRANLVFAQRGLPPAAVSAYLSGYANDYPWLDATAEFAPFQVFNFESLLPLDELRNTRYGREWLLAQGDYSAGAGVVLLRSGARQLTLEIRYRSDEALTRQRAAMVLGEAAHHFGRAFEIVTRARFSSGSGYLDSVVDDLPFAVFFVDRDLRIHYANQQAETLRRSQTGPFNGLDGVLRGFDSVSDQNLRELVEKSSAPKRQTASVLQLAPSDETRFIAIARQASRNAQNYDLHDAIFDPGPLVMLVVHGNHDGALPMDLLWRAFGLTESEASLAEALLAGSTVADYAQEREVSKQTLRNQLVGIMRKTGTRRQAELLSLLTRLSLTCV